MRELQILIATLIIIGLVLGGCAKAPALTPTPAPEEKEVELAELKPTQRLIKVEAEETVIHYQGESFWSGSDFAKIWEGKEEFSSLLKERFVSDVSKDGERGGKVINAEVEFNEGQESTILRCDVQGAVSKSGDSYQATFFWLLRPLGLDFIDSHFKESEKGLFWEGSLNGVPTNVGVNLPTIDDLIYEAWAHPIGHCHAHVWWEIK